MINRILGVLAIASLFGMLLVYSSRHMGLNGMPGHGRGMMHSTPRNYAGYINPVPTSANTLALGARLYGKNCAACHGEAGRGDGPAGRQLRPRPANLQQLARMPMATDAYLFWKITEGGQTPDSPMPPFGEVLTERERWSIAAYLRSRPWR